MSFRYGGRFIALDNYAQIFEECSPDILDEIRSAVLDNTPIADFIDPVGDDSYLLGQLRMALREGVPYEYLDVRLTGKTVYNIRQGFKRRVSMRDLVWYFPSKALRVDKEIIEVLSEFCLIGANISRVDFTLVPRNLVQVICKGLYKGYPMWLITDYCSSLGEADIHTLMRGMELGIDIHPFIRGDWDRNVLLLLFSYAKSVDVNEVLRYINSKFNGNQIKVLLDLMSAGIPISRLCVRDSEDAPVYNYYQMYELGESLKLGVDLPAMFNPRNSDFAIAQMRKQYLESQGVAT